MRSSVTTSSRSHLEFQVKPPCLLKRRDWVTRCRFFCFFPVDRKSENNDGGPKHSHIVRDSFRLDQNIERTAQAFDGRETSVVQNVIINGRRFSGFWPSPCVPCWTWCSLPTNFFSKLNYFSLLGRWLIDASLATAGIAGSPPEGSSFSIQIYSARCLPSIKQLPKKQSSGVLTTIQCRQLRGSCLKAQSRLIDFLLWLQTKRVVIEVHRSLGWAFAALIE